MILERPTEQLALSQGFRKQLKLFTKPSVHRPRGTETRCGERGKAQGEKSETPLRANYIVDIGHISRSYISLDLS